MQTSNIQILTGIAQIDGKASPAPQDVSGASFAALFIQIKLNDLSKNPILTKEDPDTDGDVEAIQGKDESALETEVEIQELRNTDRKSTESSDETLPVQTTESEQKPAGVTPQTPIQMALLQEVLNFQPSILSSTISPDTGFLNEHAEIQSQNAQTDAAKAIWANIVMDSIPPVEPDFLGSMPYHAAQIFRNSATNAGFSPPKSLESSSPFAPEELKQSNISAIDFVRATSSMLISKPTQNSTSTVTPPDDTKLKKVSSPNINQIGPPVKDQPIPQSVQQRNLQKAELAAKIPALNLHLSNSSSLETKLVIPPALSQYIPRETVIFTNAGYIPKADASLIPLTDPQHNATTSLKTRSLVPSQAYTFGNAPNSVQATTESLDTLVASAVEMADVVMSGKEIATIDSGRQDVSVSVHQSTSTPQEMTPVKTARFVAAQMADALAHKPDHPVEIALNPEELGRVRISLTHADTGLSVTITAERPETLELMRRHIEQLATEFRRLGYHNVGFEFSGGDSNRSDTSGSGSQSSPDPNIDQSSSEAPTAKSVKTTGVDLRL